MANTGEELESREAISLDSDEEGTVIRHASGEVVNMNEGSNEALIQELERKLLEGVVYSEEEAYMSYCEYAHALGFSVRRGKQYYFMGTKRVRTKTYCCSKEGIKEDKDVNGSAFKKLETRTGCKAMIVFTCDDNGQWKVTKFIKEHNHDMALPYEKPLLRTGPAILAASAFANGGSSDAKNDHDKVRELSLQLAIAKNRATTFEREAATYKRQLHMILGHIEEHNQSLAKRIQHVVNNITEMESQGRQKY